MGEQKFFIVGKVGKVVSTNPPKNAVIEIENCNREKVLIGMKKTILNKVKANFIGAKIKFLKAEPEEIMLINSRITRVKVR